MMLRTLDIDNLKVELAKELVPTVTTVGCTGEVVDIFFVPTFKAFMIGFNSDEDLRRN